MGDVLYLTIVSSIKEDILRGRLRPGDCLDSEAVLMDKFSTSRMTIRKALSLLSNEGYIYSVPGKGNFVCKPQIDIFRFKFNKYDGLNTNVDDFKLCSVKLEYPNERIARVLGVEPEEKVLECVRTLYGTNSKPLALEYIYLRYEQQKPVLEDVLKYADYLKPMEENLAFTLDKTIEINTVPAEAEVLRELKLPEGAYINRVDEIIRERTGGAAIQYVVFCVNPKYFTIKARRLLENESRKIY